MRERAPKQQSHKLVHDAPRSASSVDQQSLTPMSILHLQSTIGNEAVQRLLAGDMPKVSDNAAPKRLIHRVPASAQSEDYAETVAHDTNAALEKQREEAAIRAEWDAYPRIHYHFDNGFQTYHELRPYYLAKGINNPAEYISQNIISVTFFGRSTPAHRDLVAPLQAAATELQTNNVTPDIDSFWAFVPRLIAGGGLSNHALGRAIDINPRDNPHVINSDDIRIIQAVTGVNLGTQQTADVMRQASQTFQGLFTEAYISAELQELETLNNKTNKTNADKKKIKRLNALVTRLNGYQAHGFFNLQQELIDAFIHAGFGWGGQYQHSKDFMHFELP